MATKIRADRAARSSRGSSGLTAARADAPLPGDRAALSRATAPGCSSGPIRLRNTQYVQPWYTSTIGVNTTATQVITLSVYAVEAAFVVVSVPAGSVEDGMTLG
jgi:hypothetical protein